MAKKRNERKALINSCMRLAKAIAKERDDYTCQKCGKRGKDGWKIDASHVIPDGRCERLNTDPQNMKALCFSCHKLWWHLSPLEAGIWFFEKFPERTSYLVGMLEVHNRDRQRIQWWREWKEYLIDLTELGK